MWLQAGAILSTASCLAWAARLFGASEAELLALLGQRPQAPSPVSFRRAVQVGVGILNGQQPASSVEPLPSKLVTRDNVGQYKGWTSDRSNQRPTGWSRNGCVFRLLRVEPERCMTGCVCH